jgi:hypothetical protein
LRGTDLQAALPSRWLGFLCRLPLWSVKDKKAYESTVRTCRRNREVRSENPLNPAWIHRVTFFFQADLNLRAMGHNLAWAAQGESISLYADAAVETLQQRSLYLTRQDNLETRYNSCQAALSAGLALSSVDITAFTTYFLQGLQRRASLIKKELGFDSEAAVEVVSNSARQLAEIRKMIDSAWTDWAVRAATLPRQQHASFYKERFDLFFAPAVGVLLGGTCLLGGLDPFGPSTGGKEGATATGPVGTVALSQADGAPSRQPRTPVKAEPPPPQPPLPAVALYSSPWPLSQPPPPPQPPPPRWLQSLVPSFGFGASSASPASQQTPPTPPPQYIPPVVKSEPRSSSATRPGGSKQVQFASPPATAVTGSAPSPSASKHGASDRDSDGLGALYPADKSFVGKSASAYLSGPRSVRNIPFKKDRNGGTEQPAPPLQL